MLIEDQDPRNRSLRVSVVGAPNVGKSTLINGFLGFDLSIVSHRPQTTRNHFCCVVHVGHAEILLMDTPGAHRSGAELNIRINEQAREALERAQLVLLAIDPTACVEGQVKEVLEVLQRPLGKTWVVFTKGDLADARVEFPKELLVAQKIFSVSAQKKTNMDKLLLAMASEATSGRHLYSSGEMSNKSLRFFAAEFVREQAFLLLREELPYDLAVVVDSFEEQRDRASIGATILVSKASQRAIVVGAGGKMIREIGLRARQKLEALMRAKVYLNLHVKVSPRWKRNHFLLKELGLPRAPGSHRIWRAR